MAQVPDKYSSGGSTYRSSYMSLYVGDLDQSVSEDQLYDFFNEVGQVVSVRICRDYLTQKSLGYGYVNFSAAHHAEKAIEVLNFTHLNEKPVRIMYSIRDPSARRSGTANVFIKNLDKSIDQKSLSDVFAAFGNILSCKIAMEASGESKGYGFVQFEEEASAKEAIEKLNGMLLNNKQVYVGPFLRRQDRDNVPSDTKFNNVFVKNLSKTIKDADLRRIFGEYGVITSAIVMKDVNGESKGFGFVNFANADDAAKARDALDGKTFDDRKWYVGRALKKSEREHELKGRHDQNRIPFIPKQGTNLYIKNLNDSIGDEELKELFSEFGAITSSKIMRDPNGISKGSGFVAYTNEEEANRALALMNGRIIVGKPLYVALAEKKEERQARLQAHFSGMRACAPFFPPRIPMFSMGPPGIGPPFLYRPTPAFMPQAPVGYLQPPVPGMRPTGPPMPSFYPLPRGQRGGPPVHPPMLHQQMLPRGNFYRGPPGSDVQNIHEAGVSGEMVPFFALGQPVPLQALASAVANATPEHQRIMLGEALFPLVEKLERDAAAKVTGMLLEMDQPEVLHLIESPDALEAKVAEAMDVLRQVEHEQSNLTADHLASLSLNEDPRS